MTPEQNTDTFTAYEYATVQAPKGKEALYRDTYSNFGWQDDGFSTPGRSSAELRFKRNRNIRHRQEVVALQRKAEESLENITALERSRTRIASIVAYALGLIGTVFLGFSVFGSEAGQGTTSIVVGAIGIAFWVAAPLTYQAVRASRTKRVRPRIEQRLDDIHAACQQADTHLRPAA